MEKACEIYVSNQYYEILQLSRIDLLGNKDKILLHSSDGETFSVSKFIFNFLSSLANPEADSILTPIPSTHLAQICHMLNLRNDLKGDVTELEEDFNLLGLDFRSCENLASALNERNVKMVKRDPDILERDFENNQQEDVQDENYSICFSSYEEISKEPFPLVAKFEDTDGDGGNYKESNNENIVEADIIAKDPDNRINGGTTKLKRRKATLKYMGNPKTTTKLVEGITELESLECRICGQIYKRKEEGGRGQHNLLRRYNKHVHRHKVSVLKCGCNIVFKSTQERRDHMKSVHESFLKCNQCHNTYKDKQNLEKHKANVHCLRVCHLCSFITKAGSNKFKYHLEKMHQVQVDDKKPIIELKCTFEGCEKIFYRQWDLNQHHNRVHVTSECPICHKLVKNMQQHVDSIHLNKRNVFCEKCGKGFRYQALLDQHDEVEHQGVRFQCRYPDCQFKDQQYRDKSNRAAHERNKHGSLYTKFSTGGS